MKHTVYIMALTWQFVDVARQPDGGALVHGEGAALGNKLRNVLDLGLSELSPISILRGVVLVGVVVVALVPRVLLVVVVVVGRGVAVAAVSGLAWKIKKKRK